MMAHLLRIDGRRARQEGQRRQRLVVGGILVEVDIIGGHQGHPSAFSSMVLAHSIPPSKRSGTRPIADAMPRAPGRIKRRRRRDQLLTRFRLLATRPIADSIPAAAGPIKAPDSAEGGLPMSRYHETYASWKQDPAALLGRGRQGDRLGDALDRGLCPGRRPRPLVRGGGMQHLLERRRPPCEGGPRRAPRRHL